MKTKGNRTANLSLLLLLLLSFQSQLPGSAQAVPSDPYPGFWEGSFMGDFRTVIRIIPSEKGYTGNIVMYSGPQMIQDDPITEISVEGDQLNFFIPAKETRFTGTFNKEITSVTGIFIFPDGSEHPIEVRKSPEDVGPEASEEQYLELRNRLYDPSLLKEDLLYLVEQLKNNHPRLYSYTTEREMDDAVERILGRLDRQMGLEEYFLLISPLVEMVRCSHTGIRLPSEYLQQAAAYGNYLPLRIICERGRIYYLSAIEQPDPGIAPGTEIASINGIPTAEILAKLWPMVNSEGFNTTTRYFCLNKQFHDLYHIIDRAALYEVEFLTLPVHKTVGFHACTHEVLSAGTGEEKTRSPLYFILNDEIPAGILRVSSFEIPDMDWYMGELERVFNLLEQKGTPNLILDLRGNPGGHPIFAAQLLSYLVEEDFTYFRRNPDVEEFEPLYHPMQPDPCHFKGKLYVLVDGGCLSTTGHLISQIKYRTHAVFIGQEPGSTFRCNDFSIKVSLANTAIEANIPRVTFETAVEGFREGVPFPLDHPVRCSISDAVQGIDRILLYCEELASGS